MSAFIYQNENILALKINLKNHFPSIVVPASFRYCIKRTCDQNRIFEKKENMWNAIRCVVKRTGALNLPSKVIRKKWQMKGDRANFYLSI